MEPILAKWVWQEEQLLRLMQASESNQTRVVSQAVELSVLQKPKQVQKFS